MHGKRYRVWAVSVERFYLDIDADTVGSPEEAMEVARNTDGGEFMQNPMDPGTWDIDSVEEIGGEAHA